MVHLQLLVTKQYSCTHLMINRTNLVAGIIILSLLYQIVISIVTEVHCCFQKQSVKMLFMSLGCGIRCASGLYRSHARIMMSSITTSGTYRIQSAQLSSCAKQGLPRSNVPFFIGRGHLEPAPNQGGLQKSSISSCTHGLSSCTSKGVPWSISYHGLSLCAHEASSCSSGGLLRFPSVVQPVFILSTRPYHGNHQKHTSRQEKTVLLYICSLGIVMLGLAYAGVPLYRMFCQVQQQLSIEIKFK